MRPGTRDPVEEEGIQAGWADTRWASGCQKKFLTKYLFLTNYFLNRNFFEQKMFWNKIIF
jgi:hypothetical protein